MRMSVDNTATLWLAWCSDTKHTITECIEYTREVLAAAESSARKALEQAMGSHCSVLYSNRDDGSMSLMDEIMALDSQYLARGAIGVYVNEALRGLGNTSDALSAIEAYLATYGEDTDILLQKLRLLTAFNNYADHTDEVATLLKAINPENVMPVAGII